MTTERKSLIDARPLRREIDGNAAWVADVVQLPAKDLSSIAEAIRQLALIPVERRKRALGVVSVLIFDSASKGKNK